MKNAFVQYKRNYQNILCSVFGDPECDSSYELIKYLHCKIDLEIMIMLMTIIIFGHD